MGAGFSVMFCGNISERPGKDQILVVFQLKVIIIGQCSDLDTHRALLFVALYSLMCRNSSDYSTPWSIYLFDLLNAGILLLLLWMKYQRKIPEESLRENA